MSLLVGGVDAAAVYAGAVAAQKVYLGGELIWSAATPVYTDDFNRPDSTTSAGPDWVNRSGAVGIVNDAAYPATGGVWCVASNTAAAIAGDDMEVSMTIGASLGGADHSGDYAIVVLGASDAGVGVMCDTSPYLAGFGIYTFTDWPLSTAANVASAPGVWTAGDVLKLARVGDVYTAYLNGAPTGCVWTDSGNVVPRDASHRITGVGMFNTGSGGLTVDSFAAAST